MEYKNFSSKFTLQTQRKTEYRGQYKRKQTIINIILISAIKRITKDHYSITKDYQSIFYRMKDKCKNTFALYLRPYIPILQY